MNNFIITHVLYGSNSSKLKIFPLKSNRIDYLLIYLADLLIMIIFVFIYLSILQFFCPFGVNSCSRGGDSKQTSAQRSSEPFPSCSKLPTSKLGIYTKAAVSTDTKPCARIGR